MYLNLQNPYPSTNWTPEKGALSVRASPCRPLDGVPPPPGPAIYTVSTLSAVGPCSYLVSVLLIYFDILIIDILCYVFIYIYNNTTISIFYK